MHVLHYFGFRSNFFDSNQGIGKCNSGVNFINVKRAHFLYECLFSSYILALNELSYKKFARLTLMKLTAGEFYTSRFHIPFCTVRYICEVLILVHGKICRNCTTTHCRWKIFLVKEFLILFKTVKSLWYYCLEVKFIWHYLSQEMLHFFTRNVFN